MSWLTLVTHGLCTLALARSGALRYEVGHSLGYVLAYSLGVALLTSLLAARPWDEWWRMVSEAWASQASHVLRVKDTLRLRSAGEWWDYWKMQGYGNNFLILSLFNNNFSFTNIFSKLIISDERVIGRAGMKSLEKIQVVEVNDE